MRILVTVSFERSESVIFPAPLGSEVWHPICKQAARAEKKLKVRSMVFHATFCHRLEKALLSCREYQLNVCPFLWAP